MATRRPQRRRPVRRTAPRRRSVRSRRQRQRDRQLLLLTAGVLAAAAAWVVISWLAAHWWVLIVMAAVAVVCGAWWAHRYQQQRSWDRVRRQALRYGLPQLDALHHRDFEYAVRDLMRRDGCTDARQIGGAGDNGADVLATDPHGRTWVIQCKHRRDGDRGSAVGTPTSSESTAPPASSMARTSSWSSPTAASPPAAHRSPPSCTCTWPTGGPSPPGPAADVPCGSSSRRFPRPVRAGSTPAAAAAERLGPTARFHRCWVHVRVANRAGSRSRAALR